MKTKRMKFIEEVVNSITHGVGIVLSIAALTILVAFAALKGDVWHIVSFSIFGASLILLYTSSTLYHSTKWPIRAMFNKLDHAAIYVLIAGTYTPFALVTLRGPWGWSIFGVIWGLAVAGIVFKMFFYTDRLRKLSAILYLLMGWMVVIAIGPLIEKLSLGGLIWLLAGGLSYSLGVIFYLWQRLPFGHGIWHLFVLGGSICHFFAILLHVLPS